MAEKLTPFEIQYQAILHLRQEISNTRNRINTECMDGRPDKQGCIDQVNKEVSEKEKSLGELITAAGKAKVSEKDNETKNTKQNSPSSEEEMRGNLRPRFEKH